MSLKEGNDLLVLEKGGRTVELKDGDDGLKVKGKRHVETGGDEERKHGGNVVINVKGDYTLKVSGNLTIEAGGTLALKSAKAQFSAKQGMEIFSSANLSVSAQTELTQKAMMVDIKANAKGTLSAGAMLEVKGGLVKIN